MSKIAVIDRYLNYFLLVLEVKSAIITKELQQVYFLSKKNYLPIYASKGNCEVDAESTQQMLAR